MWRLCRLRDRSEWVCDIGTPRVACSDQYDSVRGRRPEQRVAAALRQLVALDDDGCTGAGDVSRCTVRGRCQREELTEQLCQVATAVTGQQHQHATVERVRLPPEADGCLRVVLGAADGREGRGEAA